ncbi:MAG: hypothetical protein M3415_01670 [Actinomycetota bacterium]|nr:hypothetical protein [Actinomycetota bacterium]
MSPEQLLGSAEFGDAVVIADLEAGIGTLTRLGDATVDVVVVVVEPTPKSIEVGSRAVELAREKSVTRLIVVANRVRNDDDRDMVATAFPGVTLVAVPDDRAVIDAERRGVAPLDSAPDAPAVQALVGLAERLVSPAA